MSRFEELGLALAKKSVADIDKTIKDNKLEAEVKNSPLLMEKSQIKIAENEIKHKQLVEKLQKDLANQAIKEEQAALNSGNVFAGGNLLEGFSPQVEQEAQGLPIIEQMGR